MSKTAHAEPDMEPDADTDDAACKGCDSKAGMNAAGRCKNCGRKVPAGKPARPNPFAKSAHATWLEGNDLPDLVGKRGGMLSAAQLKQRRDAANGRGGGAGGKLNAVRRAHGRHLGGNMISNAVFNPTADSKMGRKAIARTDGRKATYRNASRTAGLRQAEGKHGATVYSGGHAMRGAVVWNSKKDRRKARLKAGGMVAAVVAGSAAASMLHKSEHDAWLEANNLPSIG